MSDGNEQLDNGDEGNVQGYVNTDGSFGDMSIAPENVRNFVSKNGYKDVSSMVESHQELQSFVGQREKILRIPDEGDTEGWAKANIRLGMPEKAEDYKLNIADNSSLKGETDLINSFKTYAHQGGMPQKGFDSVVNFYEAAMESGEKEYKRQMDEAQEAIRGRFDTEDEYNKYTQKALGFAEQFKLDNDRSVADVIEDRGLAHDPEILEMLSKLADSTSEDALPRSEASGSPVSRADKITAITNNPAFTDAFHPGHNKLMEEWKALFLPQKQEG